MKKTLIALAAVAATTGVFAQATISGQMDFDIKGGNNTASTFNQGTAAINFTASEDLGGGLTAGVSIGLEAIGADGAVTADHVRMTLGSSTLGTVTVARAISGNGIMARGQAGAAVMGFDGSILGAESEVASLGYSSPRMMGLQATYGMTQKDGKFATKSQTVGVNYSEGAISAAADLTVANGAKASNGRVRLSASYDLGVAKIGGGYEYQGNRGDNYTVGVTVPMGQFTLGAAVSGMIEPASPATANTAAADKDSMAVEAAVSYALSKRTSITGAYAYLNDEAVDSIAGASRNSYRLRLRHSF